MKVWRRNWSQSAKILCSYHQGGGGATPNHVALAMTVRHRTGSAKVIDLLNELGPSVSSSYVLQHDTALANKQLERKTLTVTPEGFDKKNKFTTLVFDNGDFQEETVRDGHYPLYFRNCNTTTNCDVYVPEVDVGECLPPKN